MAKKKTKKDDKAAKPKKEPASDDPILVEAREQLRLGNFAGVNVLAAKVETDGSKQAKKEMAAMLASTKTHVHAFYIGAAAVVVVLIAMAATLGR